MAEVLAVLLRLLRPLWLLMLLRNGNWEHREIGSHGF